MLEYSLSLVKTGVSAHFLPYLHPCALFAHTVMKATILSTLCMNYRTGYKKTGQLSDKKSTYNEGTVKLIINEQIGSVPNSSL